MNRKRSNNFASERAHEILCGLDTKGYEKAAMIVLVALSVILPSLFVYTGPLLLVNYVVTRLNPISCRVTLASFFL